MNGVLKLSRRSRWAVPAGALAVTGAVVAGSLITVAQAAPTLPARTPAQLLASIAAVPSAPALTGTVVETASLGLPSLPTTHNATSIASLLTGTHTVKVWYADSQHYRLALPQSLSETDVFRNGSTLWLWESTGNAVTKVTLPAHTPAAPSPAPPALTPQQAAQAVLAAVGPTTTVSVDSNVVVAGQDAYELVLAPKDARSLVGQVRIAVDGSNDVPLRVEVFARGATSPAITVGYTAISFGAPQLPAFTPPPGAKVTDVSPHHGGHSGSSEGSTIGSGWLTVLDAPSSTLTSGPAIGAGQAPAGAAPGGAVAQAGDSGAVLRTLIDSATPVSGAWGHGRLLRTSLITVLVTDNGRLFAGAVQPSVLYAAASSSK